MVDLLRKKIEGTANVWPVESVYTTVLHGQTVTVTRYAPAEKPKYDFDEDWLKFSTADLMDCVTEEDTDA